MLQERCDNESLKIKEKSYTQERLLSLKESKLSDSSFHNSMFTYAHSLLQSNYRKDWILAKHSFRELYELTADQKLKRDCLFYSSLIEIKLHNYKSADRFAKAILYFEPFNSQALALTEYIQNVEKKNFIIGSSVIGTALVSGLLVLGGIFLR